MKSTTRTTRNALPEGHLRVIESERAQIDRVRFPDLADLMAKLHFSTNDGCIWLDDQRMLLVHARALGWLRREMIETLGLDVARMLLTRMGYNAGTYDAQLARKVRSGTSMTDMFVVGPQMHCLEGVGLSEPVRIEFDVATGAHYGEFVWTHPVEDDEHLRHFGIGSEPSCWMQIGYASGYSTEFMGRQILYREVECQSMGHAACRIIGKPVEEWGEEGVSDLRYLLGARGGLPLPVVSTPAEPVLLPDAAPAESHAAVGMSPGFNSVLYKVQRAAPTSATVLFLGESGVGKEVFARTLHRLSKRADKPFVAVNCAAIPEHLIESELFGAERGAYTSATASRQGRFERADGGTLFLDEIGTLTLGAQGILLRALQEGEIERLGDSRTRRVDVRVVAATNVDLREQVESGNFREDLFFRLNVFPIRVTPLRERREDIPLLISHFLGKYNRQHDRKISGFTRRAIDAMMSYDWPGNIRELENVIERGVILGNDNNPIDASQLFTSGEHFDHRRFEVSSAGRLVASDPKQLLAEAAPPEKEVEVATRCINGLLRGFDEIDSFSLDEVETLLLRKAVERTQGNLSAAARLLGITRPQIVYRLKSRGILQGSE